MPKLFDNRVGKVSSVRDQEKDLQYAKNLNRFVLLLAVAVTIVLFFW